mmetsp:Transcript_16909/g.26017  ORF Transcript_16909/g.26017 Transcript_16909/m.26017 type:complete len:125 (+) Transcript_16909:10-384(+)
MAWKRFISPAALLKYFCLLPLTITNDFLSELQTMEWVAMLYIIETQKKRTVEQILTEHHIEDLKQSIRESKQELMARKELTTSTIGDKVVDFRRREIYLIRAFAICLVALTLFHTINFVLVINQ